MRTSLDAQAETRSGASERQTRAKSYGKEDVTYGDEIKAHAKTGCAGEVSVIGVLAIYICIHQPSIYAPVSSERILVYEPNDDVRSFSFLLHRSLLFIVLFFSARLAFSLAFPFNFFLVLPARDTPVTYVLTRVRTHGARNATRYVPALFQNSVADARASHRRHCRSFPRFGTAFSSLAFSQASERLAKRATKRIDGSPFLLARVPEAPTEILAG